MAEQEKGSLSSAVKVEFSACVGSDGERVGAETRWRKEKRCPHFRDPKLAMPHALPPDVRRLYGRRERWRWRGSPAIAASPWRRRRCGDTWRRLGV